MGRISLAITDAGRSEPLSLTPGAKRRIMVHVWYPADTKKIKNKATAPYMPGFDEVRAKLPDADVDDMFRPASYTGTSSLPRTDVVENAPFTFGKQRFPLLLFAHGWSNPTSLYTAELEDLVSHGYVIAAINHPYDTDYTQFPDGTMTFFAHKSFDEAAAKPRGLNAYASERVDVMAQDNRFALTEILKYANTKSLKAPFYRRVDMGKVGAFGHSIGGLTSARTCQIDPRVLACMDQDSIDYRGSPFAVSDLQQTESQPFFLFVVSSADIWSSKMVHPTDEELVSQKLTRAEYDTIIRKQQENQNEQFAAIPGGRL